MGWIGFAAAYLAFFISHSLPLRPSVRSRLIAVLGRGGFALAYSALSLAVLVWLIVAAGRAPQVTLWDWAPWQPWTTLTIMMGVCLLAAFSLGAPNPLSFGGVGNARFDPCTAGVVRLVRHPLLAVLGLWAVAHLISNGDLAHVILFGSFALFAGLGGRLVDRRRRCEMGGDWARLVAELRAAPLLSFLARPVVWGLRAAAGVGLYAVLIWLHPLVIGVYPLPF